MDWSLGWLGWARAATSRSSGRARFSYVGSGWVKFRTGRSGLGEVGFG